MIETLKYDVVKNQYNHFCGGEQLKIKISNTWLKVSIQRTKETGRDGWELVFEDVFVCNCSRLEGYQIKPAGGAYWKPIEQYQNKKTVELENKQRVNSAKILKLALKQYKSSATEKEKISAEMKELNKENADIQKEIEKIRENLDNE